MTDTIVALATPPGISGLAVIRLSGNMAFDIIDKCFKSKQKIKEANTHTIHYGKVYSNEILIDTVTVSVFKSPHSYTGEDIIEISCHGGYLIANQIIELLQKNGATTAPAGEFTRRAFINGKLDLTQVEAVADIIHSVSIPGQHIAARQITGGFNDRINQLRLSLINIASMLELELDFAEDNIQLLDKSKIIEQINLSKMLCIELADSFKASEILRSGFQVAIIGFPNSGKSTLFNTFLKRDRALVSDKPGTTRDYLEEFLYINGIAFKLIDTAGIRETDDFIEIEGIKLVYSILEQADLILILNDITLGEENTDALYKEIKNRITYSSIVVLQNKIDKYVGYENLINTKDKLYISAKKHIGIDKLKSLIYNYALHSTSRLNDVLINQRQAILLSKAKDCLDNAILAINSGYENELIALDVKNAALAFSEITGHSFSNEVLNNIFSNFCIGK